jgi:hypothetical protein
MAWNNVGNIKGPAGTTTWAGITDKPSTFTPSSHSHSDSDISNASTVGKAVLEATDAGAARTAIGAGTSSLSLGTTAGTACEGNDSRLPSMYFWKGTAAAYAAIGSKDANTIYFVTA